MKAYVKEENSSIPINLTRSANVPAFRKTLLEWYDGAQRYLPWRVRKQEQKNAYHTWLSEIMLQQTTVQAVKPYFLNFIQKWPEVTTLAKAQDDDVMAAWAGLGYYARARNLLKCARIIANPPYNGEFPQDYAALASLPGIGPYTASAISAIAFDQPSVVVDGNVERVMSRLFNIHKAYPDSKKEIYDKAAFLSKSYTDAPGNYAQAMMDLGATICTPRKPKCYLCPVKKYCGGFYAGQAEQLPKRKPKTKKPHRQGQMFWIENSQGEVLIEKRNSSRMLGNMSGLPGSNWDKPELNDENIADILYKITGLKFNSSEEPLASVKHSFTHFHLTLEIYSYKSEYPASYCYEYLPDKYRFIAKQNLLDIGLPSLYKKAAQLVFSNK